MSEFAFCKLDVFFSRAISAAENKPSYKFDNRRLYQKSRIGELPHFCNVSEKVQSIGDVCAKQTRSVFRQCQLHCLK